MNFYDIQTAQERAQERYEPILQENAIKRAFPEESSKLQLPGYFRHWIGKQLVQWGYALQKRQSEAAHSS